VEPRAANARGFRQAKFRWAALTGQELTDILVYLQNLPETRDLTHRFRVPAHRTRERSCFKSKGCVTCHSGATALEHLLKNQTLTDIAADMWDHQPEMKQPSPAMSPEEMRQIIGYIWTRQYFTGTGSAERGKKVFAAKSCSTCHNDPSSGAPKLTKGQSDIHHGSGALGARSAHAGRDELEEDRVARGSPAAADGRSGGVLEFAVSHCKEKIIGRG